MFGSPYPPGGYGGCAILPDIMISWLSIKSKRENILKIRLLNRYASVKLIALVRLTISHRCINRKIMPIHK